MKKRIKLKTEKRNHMKRHQVIFDEIEKQFTFKRKTFGNGQGVRTFGKCGVCWFWLKELPDWRFGIWLEDDGSYELFGEHEDFLDKFRPGKIYIDYRNDLDNFIKAIKGVHKHPIYHIALGYLIGRNESVDNDKVHEVYNEHLKEKEEEQKEINEDRKRAFDFFKELLYMYDEIIKIRIIDGNIRSRGYISTYSRYGIRPEIRSNITDNRIDEMMKEISELVWNKDDEQKTHRHHLQFDGLYWDIDRDRTYSFYDYIYVKENKNA